MRVREWFWPENLLSMSRVVLAPLTWYFLSRPEFGMLGAAVATIIIAGITDGLDGIVARRRKQPGSLGLLLDPVADKIFAGIMVIALVQTRDFPVWAAAVIIGRDLLIVVAAMILLGSTHVPLHSNLSGKYAFFAIIVLLMSYVIRFPFGQTLLLGITMILIVMSVVTYARVFLSVRRGQAPPEFADSAGWRTVRKLAIAIFALIYLFAFYLYYGEWRERWRSEILLRQATGVDGQSVNHPVAIDHIHMSE